MKRTYSIFTKFMEFEIDIQTKTVETHSVLSDDNNLGRDLKDVLMLGIDGLRRLIREFEQDHEQELSQIGK